MRIVQLFASLLFAMGLAGCSSSSGCGRYDDCEPDYAAYDDAAANVDPSDVDAEDVEQPEFDNCTEDCSGHEAGFAWAQSNDVTDVSECGGNTNSFIEGCEAFAEQREQIAEEQAEDARDDYEEDTGDDGGRWIGE